MKRRVRDTERKLAVSPTAPVYDPLFLNEAQIAVASGRRALLLALPQRPSRQEKLAAAEAFGVSVRQMDRYRAAYAANGTLSCLLPTKRSGGRNVRRKSPEHTIVFDEVVREWDRLYPEASDQALINEIQIRQRKRGLVQACHNTLASWLRQVPERQRVKQKYGGKLARELFEPIKGSTPETHFPLQRVQIDHTLLDQVALDDDRLPVGRPWFTTAIDEYSRANLGFVLSWEYPSASTVALLMTRIMLPKDDWLREIGCKGSWPMFGTPSEIYTDNAAEFRSAALIAGCREWGPRLEKRPKGLTHFGGIIERYMRTVMDEMKLLPGNTAWSRWYGRKVTRDPEETATMTRRELECWLAEFITGEYHKRPHSTTGQRPDLAWQRGVDGTRTTPGIGRQPIISDVKKLYLDFSDYVERTIQRYGVQWDGFRYWSDELRPFLDTGDKRRFVVRRNPLDGSRVYVMHPQEGRYIDLATTDLGIQAGTVCEMRSRLKQRLGERDPPDHQARQESADRRREIEDAARQSKKKKARRRAHERREDGLQTTREIDRGQPTPVDLTTPAVTPALASIFAPGVRRMLRIEE